MKTKLLSLFLALVASVGTIFANGYQIGYFYYLLDWDNETAEVTYEAFNHNSNYADLWYLSLSGQIGYNGTIFTVTSIGVKAFLYSPITTLVIAESITSIKATAFYDSGITSIDIPNSVNYIGDAAFSHCMNLEVPLYNAKIFAALPISHSGDYTIPEGINTIAGGAFDGCTGLTSVTIPNSVTSIGNYAFRSCSGLTSVTIPNSVTSIGYDAFAYCSGLTSVTIPNSVTSIGNGAFTTCSGLTSVTIPNSVTSIGNDAFAWCSSLTSVTIPNSVTSIGNNAFRDCSSLTSVEIPNSVTSIGDGAFYKCSSLTSISNYANTPQKIYSSVFDKVDKSTCILYVPLNSIDLYKAAEGWKEFKQILPISAEETETTETTVETTETSAEITWPSVSGAYTYELIIKDQSGNIICTLVFDSEGRLKSITFLAPGRNRALQQSQTAGFSFTVNNLNSGSTYTYTLTAKDASDNILDTESGSFTTTGEGVPTAIDNIDSSSLRGGDRGRLIYRNGQIYILRDGHTYTVTGAEVK